MMSPLLPEKASILAIGAHHDDIELGCGGTIARYVARGCDVTMLVLTDSSYNGMSDRRSKATALSEGQAAAEALGVASGNVLSLGLPSLDLKWNSEVVKKIDSVLLDVEPDLVMMHWPFDTHQDHSVAGWATLASARRCKFVMAYEPFSPSGKGFCVFRPQVYVNIESTLPTKMKALACHVSQAEKYGDEWTEALLARARVHGHNAGCKYAEAFELSRMTLE